MSVYILYYIVPAYYVMVPYRIVFILIINNIESSHLCYSTKYKNLYIKTMDIFISVFKSILNLPTNNLSYHLT